MTSAASRIVIDNERVRATLWSFAPDQDTGWHRHEHDYVVIPLGDGRLRLDLPGGGEAFADLRHGEPYFRNAGVEHNVINASEHDFQFLEIEILAK